MSKKRLMISWIVLFFLASIPCANAVCPPSGCGSSTGDWESSAQDFLNSDIPVVGVSKTYDTMDSSFKAGDAAKNASRNGMDYALPAYRSDLFPEGRILRSMQSVSSSDLVLDVSKGRAEGDGRIRGSVHVSFDDLLYENGTIKPVPDIAKILGDAGISSSDPVVVYSDSFQSGEAAFVFWVMRYLGHDNVKLLDGDLLDWTKASLPLDTEQKMLPSASYTAKPKPQLLADYEYVKSEEAQTVDARSFQEFGKGRIQSAFFIRADDVLEGGRIKDSDRLNETFAKLDKDRPAVVYSSDILKASLVWYALQLMGFDSRIYTWQDWQAHEQPDVY